MSAIVQSHFVCQFLHPIDWTSIRQPEDRDNFQRRTAVFADVSDRYPGLRPMGQTECLARNACGFYYSQSCRHYIYHKENCQLRRARAACPLGWFGYVSEVGHLPGYGIALCRLLGIHRTESINHSSPAAMPLQEKEQPKASSPSISLLCGMISTTMPTSWFRIRLFRVLSAER